MTGSKKSKDADSLTKSASVELTEAALGEASGGALSMNAPALNTLKIDSSLKLDNKASDANLLLPAVQKP
jgi:hypothetical protein